MIESFRKANYDYVKKIKELEETNINQKVKKKIFFFNDFDQYSKNMKMI